MNNEEKVTSIKIGDTTYKLADDSASSLCSSTSAGKILSHGDESIGDVLCWKDASSTTATTISSDSKLSGGLSIGSGTSIGDSIIYTPGTVSIDPSYISASGTGFFTTEDMMKNAMKEALKEISIDGKNKALEDAKNHAKEILDLTEEDLCKCKSIQDMIEMIYVKSAKKTARDIIKKIDEASGPVDGKAGIPDVDSLANDIIKTYHI